LSALKGFWPLQSQLVLTPVLQSLGAIRSKMQAYSISSGGVAIDRS
jgi:hypothetical protein